ncbi:unnamed protein product [Closterium sp. Naga37s-1]|nr:unnamed protein product [Closterium sp. Naga37s-1]
MYCLVNCLKILTPFICRAVALSPIPPYPVPHYLPSHLQPTSITPSHPALSSPLPPRRPLPPPLRRLSLLPAVASPSSPPSPPSPPRRRHSFLPAVAAPSSPPSPLPPPRRRLSLLPAVASLSSPPSPLLPPRRRGSFLAAVASPSSPPSPLPPPRRRLRRQVHERKRELVRESGLVRERGLVRKRGLVRERGLFMSYRGYQGVSCIRYFFFPVQGVQAAGFLRAATWCSQDVALPVATWRGGGSHPAKFPHTFLPPPPAPPSAGLAFVPRFTALRGEWPSPSPLPATPPSAHAAGRKGKEGGGSKRQSRGKGGSVGGGSAAAGAEREEGEEAWAAGEEDYMEDGAMLVVQPRPHPRWLLRAKLGEALRLVDSLTGTDSQWEMEQRSWGGAGRGEESQQGGAAREWQGEGEQWRQGEEAEAEWRRRSEGWERSAGRSVRSGDGVEGFGFPPPGGGHPWVVVHSRGRGIRAGSFFGSGTIESIAAHVHASHTMGVPVEAVFVNATLSGVQQRNLEVAWGLPVVDRVGLIIEIFGARANTREAKLQVEMAGLEYQRSRLVRQRGSGGRRLGFGLRGEQQVVSARGRAAGGRGFLAGAGESELQLQRRRISEKQHKNLGEAAQAEAADRASEEDTISEKQHKLRQQIEQNIGEAAQAEAADRASEEDTISEKQHKLRQQIAQVRRTRGLHRLARRRASWEGGGKGRGLPVVAVVGYTNAGKSTLVTALSQSPQYIDDRLFATLDPRVRAVKLPSGRRVLLSDTVGFISDLPHQLVEAFHATLEEVVEADLLLHVVDASAPDMHQQRQAVLHVLTQMGVPVDPGMAADVSMAARGSSMGVGDGGYGGPPSSLAPPALGLVHSRVTPS